MNLAKNIALTWNLGRTIHFASAQRLLPLVEKLATGKEPWAPKDLPKKRKELLTALVELLKNDAENFGAGVFPLEVLKPEPYLKHGLRLLKIMGDSFKLSRRKQGRKHKEFGDEAKSKLKGLPEYYQRNFHYQTDGYLSAHSADLYDHQVDILFAGATDAMRRALLAAMKPHLPKNPKLLEVGCGTGRLTQFVAMSVPGARITAVDPSAPYLERANERLNGISGVSFLEAFGEKTKLKSNSFSAAYSAFLFHELPSQVRADVLEEMVRLCKPGGVIAILDSLQLGDVPQFDWSLKRFPLDFHEPFYKGYTEDKMEGWPAKVKGLELIEASHHFLGKVGLFRVRK